MHSTEATSRLDSRNTSRAKWCRCSAVRRAEGGKRRWALHCAAGAAELPATALSAGQPVHSAFSMQASKQRHSRNLSLTCRPVCVSSGRPYQRKLHSTSPPGSCGTGRVAWQNSGGAAVQGSCSQTAPPGARRQLNLRQRKTAQGGRHPLFPFQSTHPPDGLDACQGQALLLQEALARCGCPPRRRRLARRALWAHPLALHMRTNQGSRRQSSTSVHRRRKDSSHDDFHPP